MDRQKTLACIFAMQLKNTCKQLLILVRSTYSVNVEKQPTSQTHVIIEKVPKTEYGNIHDPTGRTTFTA